MTNGMRVVVALAGLLALAGVAAAQDPLENVDVGNVAGMAKAYVDPSSHGEGATSVDAGEAAAAAEGGLYGDGNYGDLDGTLVTKDAGAVVDADGSVSDVEETANGGFWSWLQVSLRAVASSLGDLLGIDEDVSESVDADAEAYVSTDGVDLDAGAAVLGEHVDFDASEVGGLDDLTWAKPLP